MWERSKREQMGQIKNQEYNPTVSWITVNVNGPRILTKRQKMSDLIKKKKKQQQDPTLYCL